MATYKPAAHIADIRGHIQNAVYSKNRLGNYLKLRKAPLDRRTADQLTQRSLMHDAVAYWHDTLGDAGRILWNNLGLLTNWYNKSGIAYHPSGFNLFTRMYLFCIPTPGAMDYDAPDAAAAAAPTFTFTTDAGFAAVITADAGWCTGKTGYVHFFTSPAFSNSIYNYSGTYLNSEWANIDDIESVLPIFTLHDLIAGNVGDRVQIIAKAYYASGSGNTVTWPQIINQPLT